MVAGTGWQASAAIIGVHGFRDPLKQFQLRNNLQLQR